ncbi:MAG: chemotaxis protein CheD [Thermodesulfobacteriota bacterium]
MGDVENYYLHPGNLFAHSEPHIVSTILGSCVAVCLFDPVLQIGGINHYLLPFWNKEGLPTPKYGNVAIQRLVEKMIALGSNKKHLEAKIFGGASQFENSNSAMLNVGQRNIQIAIDLLNKENIRILGKDVGNTQGRRVLYMTNLGKVKVRMIQSTK